MMIKGVEEITIYESPDGGKTVFSRKSGDNSRHLHSVDAKWLKEQDLQLRWVNLKPAVFMASDDPTLDDAIKKVEMLYLLKKGDVK